MKKYIMIVAINLFALQSYGACSSYSSLYDSMSNLEWRWIRNAKVDGVFQATASTTPVILFSEGNVNNQARTCFRMLVQSPLSDAAYSAIVKQAQLAMALGYYFHSFAQLEGGSWKIWQGQTTNSYVQLGMTKDPMALP